MAWKWYIQIEDRIDGPFATDEVRARFSDGQLLPSHLIWAPGQEQWRSLQAWTQDLPNLANPSGGSAGPEAWHFALNGQSRGPLARQALLDELKNMDSLGEVMIWTKGMQEWAPLFDFHDLLSELGVNKRQFPRADLTGKTVITVGGNTLIAPLLSISEGGFGIALASGLVAGQSVSVELHSPSFRESLHAKADVRYIHAGIVGLKFTQMSVENKGAVIQFIKQTQMRFTIKAA